jgi:hypothetical protein
MSNETEHKGQWKERARRELVDYWITAVYLMLFFGAFITYRRLLLAEYHIHYTHYGFAIIQALVLAKIILIGDLIGVGRLRKDRPLILTTLFRAARFTVWVVLFTILEHMVEGLVRGEGLEGGVRELLHQGKYELLGHALVVFFTFIPFFAFRELDQVLGERKIWKLFFRKVAPRKEPGTGPGQGPMSGTTEYEV